MTLSPVFLTDFCDSPLYFALLVPTPAGDRFATDCILSQPVRLQRITLEERPVGRCPQQQIVAGAQFSALCSSATFSNPGH